MSRWWPFRFQFSNCAISIVVNVARKRAVRVGPSHSIQSSGGRGSWLRTRVEHFVEQFPPVGQCSNEPHERNRRFCGPTDSEVYVREFHAGY